MTHIKICGITNKLDAVRAAALGVDMLGFVFYKKSKRFVEPAVARDIISELPDELGKVGVFVDEKAETVRRIAEDAGLDTLQFHGEETPGYCASFRPDYKAIKAFRVRNRTSLRKANDYDVEYYLLDAYKADSPGGTGRRFDWKVLRDFELLRPVILSGGLTPENVAQAIAEVAPYGVDVSTGVEASAGRKDEALMRAFVQKARKA